MKKILMQLDTDQFASSFDAITAYDAGADQVMSYAAIGVDAVRPIILSACFTRGIPDLNNLAVWIGGSDVELGEQILVKARQTFFGPFKISLMLDTNGCNTTASTAIAKLVRQTDLHGKTALVIGPGPVGLRAASLLAREGVRVQLISIPPQLLGDRFNVVLAQKTLASARKAAEAFQGTGNPGDGHIQVEDVLTISRLEDILKMVEIAVAAGPAGLQLLSESQWASCEKLQWLIDFNLTEPLGIEGVKPSDDFAVREGKYALGALAVGNPKMKVHKACIARLFERNDLILDTDGVYQIAKELI
ncbi:MAG TPA: methylene-tetrahydromethanopterin dehydrogenase N-terminal domain-containing protein [Anaerolineaceae bacterium]|nr:methylene-tetrahydromethanopterin dehydrogenase N-terminal domain-containing protein [Anaerolineaceae bacterium]